MKFGLELDGLWINNKNVLWYLRTKAFLIKILFLIFFLLNLILNVTSRDEMYSFGHLRNVLETVFSRNSHSPVLSLDIEIPNPSPLGSNYREIQVDFDSHLFISNQLLFICFFIYLNFFFSMFFLGQFQIRWN